MRQDRLCGILSVRRHRHGEVEAIQAVKEPDVPKLRNPLPNDRPCGVQGVPEG